ncbi:hypothetical protein [Bacillus sp. AK128]
MSTNQKNSFAAGLLVATIVCGIAYFIEPSQAATISEVQELTEAEMKESLTSAGYIIHTKEEWNKQLAALEEVVVENETTSETEETTETIESEEEQEQVVYRTILNIASGMTSIDVGRVLVETNITDSAMSFVQEVEKRGLANDLRPGTYEINSNMTVDDVIALVFK